MFFHHAHFLFPGLFLFGISKLFGLLLLALLILALVRLFSGRTKRWGPYWAPFNQQPFGQAPAQPFGQPQPHQPPFGQPVSQLSPMEILRQRYARGEIDAATFDHMRERLQASEQPAQEQAQ
ncbi:MAG TPA: SHOCT domain-containing protein [Ktedonosporobacter sp.]|nr:SHOCT domain-containing protein [Ktedonosporobacter sp.]